ncbi:MAG: alkaline phosphatase family protein [Chloroflexota bacterium]|nr:alkaline phosphatase family protein [Chloroflexota bacterium]
MPTDTPNSDAIEAELRQKQLPALAGRLPPGEFVLPDYDGLCLANIPATIAALLGAELPGACPPLRPELWRGWADGVRRVIFILVDALGYLQLRKAMARGDAPAWNRLAERGELFPITTIFPSTTNAVLTTMWTGYSPAAHGLLAFELYLREFGVVASALFFWPVAYHQHDMLVEWGLKPKEFVPVPAVGDVLRKQGIAMRTFTRERYIESALSQMHRRGLERIDGFVGASDFWVGLRRALGDSQEERLLISAYWDEVDGISHKYGPDDDSWFVELRTIGHMMEKEFLQRLSPAERDGTLLIITADHGVVPTLPEMAVKLDDHPVLRDALLIPPVGESRAPFFYPRAGHHETVRNYLDGELGDAFVTLERSTVLESELLGPGPVYRETPYRLGDLLALPRGQHYLAKKEKSLDMLGRHGGLSPVEMLVPLFIARLDA